MADVKENKIESAVANVEHTEGFPEEIQKALNDIPPDSRRELVALFSYQQSVLRSPESEVAKKVTSEHITAMIANDSKAMDYQHEDEKQKKLMIFGLITLAAILVCSADGFTYR